jgi:hypothetical protein
MKFQDSLSVGELIARAITIFLFVGTILSCAWFTANSIIKPAPVHPHEAGDVRYDVFSR